MKYLTIILFLFPFGLFSQVSFNQLDLAFHYYLNNNIDSAKFVISKQGSLEKDKRQSIAFLHNLALLKLRENKYDSAQVWLIQSNNQIEGNSTFADLRASQYQLESDYYFKQTKFRESIEKLFEIQDFSTDLSNSKKASTFSKLAASYFRIGQIDSAFFLAKKSVYLIQNAVSLEEKNILSSTFSLLGQLYLFNGQYDSSFIFHDRALKIYRECNNVKGVGISLAEMAGVKMFQEKYRESLGYYSSAVISYKKLNLPCFSLYNNIGSVYNELELIDSANYYFNLAYQGAIQIGRYDLLANSSAGKANILMKKVEYDSASFYYSQALSLFEQMNYDYGSALCELGLANSYSKKKKFAVAQNFIDSALSKAQKMQNNILLKECYEIQSIILDEQGDFENSLQAFKSYSTIKDSLLNIETQNKIAEIEISYKTEIKEQENLMLKEELLINEERRKNTRYFYLLVTFFLIILLIALFYLNLSRRRELKIKELLIDKAKFHESLLYAKLQEAKNVILAKNQVLVEMEIKMQNEMDQIETAEKLINKINITKEWAEFTLEFNTLYKDFFTQLDMITTEKLTKNELRLAALIKLNLSNKEIASLLFVSMDGIKKAKNRLVKKIILQDNESLSSRLSRL